MANLREGQPQFIERQEQDTITAVPQDDGTIKYWLGNYDGRGEVTAVRILDGGLYETGVTPTVQLVDDNGDDISNGGAEFAVIMNTKGECISVYPKEGGLGSGLVGPVIKAKLVTAAENVVSPAELEVCIRDGQWVDIPASEVETHNRQARDKWTNETAKLSSQTNFQVLGVTDKFGKVEGFTL
tara:strand:+ start:19853 stop:20404 length:552 start_codon:yes stop_codon:yes gene_type:complete